MSKKTLKITKVHLLILLTVIGFFLRFYNLSGTLQFLGDQGRDALITYRLLIERDPVFIGPVTSIGNMYLGPAYYYFMLPFYALTYPSPMGPVYAVALLGVLTIPLLYILGKEMVGERPALLASVIYTFAWPFIYNSRFSWNPNPAPFVSLIMIWAIYRAWVKDSRYWMLVSLMFSILIQLHYMNLLSAGVAGLIWLSSIVGVLRKKDPKHTKRFILSTLGAILIFISSLTPLILFDVRNNYLNSTAFYEMIFGKEEQIRGAGSIFDVLQETHGRSMHILFELTTNNLRWLNTLLVIGVFAGIVKVLQSADTRKYILGETLIIMSLCIGIFGTSLYRSSVFDHYLAYLYPVTALILGMVLSYLWKYGFGKLAVITFFGWFFFTNVQKYDFRDLDWNINDMKQVAQSIENRVQPGEKYDVVLLAPHGDIEAMNYRYFLTVSDKQILPRERFAEADTLFIINEHQDIENVVDSPVYQIVVFPNKQPAEVYDAGEGVEVTVLKR